ncbi:hypothetical protein EVAR_11161_1 [Eumeta japonica]|uniref:Uncharacterized protein n=1 Tax=Eumeta variegata TaxID=151549 RepID=A0A4C1U4F9_EUMVA|nr:hypothetical protein EVAR_11161_1 [Eumeta japonica]
MENLDGTEKLRRSLTCLALASSSVDLPHPRFSGCRCGTEDLLLPHARASSRRGHDPDGSGGNGPSLVDPLIDILPEPSRRPTRGRARSLRRRRQVEGAPARHASVTRVGVDLTERAYRPLIKLSTRRTAAARAVRVSEPCPSTSSFLSSPCRGSIRCLRWTTRGRARHRTCAQRQVVGAPGCEEVVSEGGREARNRLHTQPTAGGRTLVDADRIKAARIGDPRWRRSNRARLPTADQAIHASDGGSQGSTCQRAASLSLFFFFDHHPSSSSSFFLRLVFGLPSSIRCSRRATRGRARH